MSTRTRALLAIIIAGILGGMAPIYMKVALKEFTPFQIAFTRFFFAFLVLLPVAFFKKQLRFHKKDFFLLLFSSLFFAGNIILFVIGLPHTSSIASQLFYLLTPTFVIILSFFLLRHKIEMKHILSIITGFIGGLILVIRGGNVAVLTASLGTTQGNILILSAVMCWSIHVVFSKKLSEKYTPLNLLVISSIVTSLISGIFLLTGKTNLIYLYTHASWPSVASLILLITLNSIVFFFLYQWAIKLVKPFSVSLSSYLSLLATAVIAIPLFGEKITVQLVISGLLIGVSSYLTFKKR